MDNQDIQAIITVEKLINESTSQTLLEPNIEKFDKIVHILCRNENMYELVIQMQKWDTINKEKARAEKPKDPDVYIRTDRVLHMCG